MDTQPTNIIKVTVKRTQSGNKYIFNGNSKQAPVIVNGKTYIFDLSDRSNTTHPLRFSLQKGTKNPYRSIARGVPGKRGAKVVFTPNGNANKVYPYCVVHGYGMGSYYQPLNIVQSSKKVKSSSLKDLSDEEF